MTQKIQKTNKQLALVKSVSRIPQTVLSLQNTHLYI